MSQSIALRCPSCLYRQYAARYVLGIVFAEGPPDWHRFEFDKA
jgi:hypothetical protein